MFRLDATHQLAARFDAFKKMCIDAASTTPDAHRPEPTLNVVIDVNTFERTLERSGLVASDSPVPSLPDLPIDAWRCETVDGT